MSIRTYRAIHPTIGGGRYFISIIDDYFEKVQVYILKSIDEAFQKLVYQKKTIEVQIGRKVKRLRTDNGWEYKKDKFKEFCRKEGIGRQNTIRDTRQQNGLAERMNKTLLERVRCLQSNATLPKNFQGETVSKAACLINMSPFTAIGFKTPEEIWSSIPPMLAHLKVFECVAYAHVKQGKLEPRALKCIFVGYPSGVKGYRLWYQDGIGYKYFISRDVTFRKDHIYMGHASTSV